MKMTDPVRVKLADGAQTTVEREYAKGFDLTIIDDEPATDLAGNALPAKDIVTVDQAAARQAGSGGRTGTSKTAARARKTAAANKAAASNTDASGGAEADTQENQ